MLFLFIVMLLLLGSRHLAKSNRVVKTSNQVLQQISAHTLFQECFLCQEPGNKRLIKQFAIFEFPRNMFPLERGVPRCSLTLSRSLVF